MTDTATIFLPRTSTITLPTSKDQGPSLMFRVESAVDRVVEFLAAPRTPTR
ncbi:hypothetical protein EDF46_3636 [Frondihabitans sp. PhB188]|uniref:hypothetical protein n=1 Tax=Frondihabitans sp. PhB188 TaxID=2485200 RepID=UPI000FA6455A|nr:hypothetical protein [Frondihabitans sp. PhB188]ROQ30254.1 hypothetical protein EDF46_3636 [Frondihabitans sp. PhB188]